MPLYDVHSWVAVRDEPGRTNRITGTMYEFLVLASSESNARAQVTAFLPAGQVRGVQPRLASLVPIGQWHTED